MQPCFGVFVMQPPDRARRFPADSALLAIAGLAAMGGIAVARMVAAGAINRIDRDVLILLRGDGPTPFGPLWFQEAVRDITALGSMIVLMLVVLTGAGYFLTTRRPALAGLLLASSAGATLFSQLLKASFDRPRPDLFDHAMATFTASFPSGHSLMAAAILLTNGGLIAFGARTSVERRLIGAIAILLTSAVGLSRIYLGVHWPSDVLAGWLFGTLWASLTLLVARRLYPAADTGG